MPTGDITNKDISGFGDRLIFHMDDGGIFDMTDDELLDYIDRNKLFIENYMGFEALYSTESIDFPRRMYNPENEERIINLIKGRERNDKINKIIE